ncbi:MAG: hypothetical protein HPY61_06135 [Methanotrichaceae archaeon]|nr:hypothetical protein [Methanotrichaceae archaeon]
MKDRASEIARLLSEDGMFQALGLAALRARARGLSPGEIITIFGLEMTVQEDESGDGIVVQYICSRSRLEGLAEDLSRDRGMDLQAKNDEEIAQMRRKILAELSQLLQRWKGISTQPGPGENLTFEMAVYRKDDSWR